MASWDPYITRAVGGNLLLNDRVNYKCDKPSSGAEPGGVIWIKEVVNSPYVHGDVLVGMRKGQGIIPLRVLVVGADQAAINAKISTLIAAFSQFTYELHLVYDGVDYGWKCQPADYMVEMRWNMYDDAVGHVPVTFNIPRHPVAIAGPF